MDRDTVETHRYIHTEAHTHTETHTHTQRHGPGIPDDLIEHLFEPFFTSDSSGSGLGLYIARELCEANQASLSLDSNSSKGCCFRINFSHEDRQII